jgi:hypothetical protein
MFTIIHVHNHSIVCSEAPEKRLKELGVDPANTSAWQWLAETEDVQEAKRLKHMYVKEFGYQQSWPVTASYAAKNVSPEELSKRSRKSSASQTREQRMIRKQKMLAARTRESMLASIKRMNAQKVCCPYCSKVSTVGAISNHIKKCSKINAAPRTRLFAQAWYGVFEHTVNSIR